MNTRPYLLITDDDMLIRAQLSDIFSEEYNIIEAKDGEEAYDILHDESMASKIVLIILDLYMPEMGGFELLEKMRNDPVCSRLPLIIMSTSNTIGDEIRAFELGATDFISKPIEPSITKIRVKNALTKIENERLFAENRLLEKKQEEEERYRIVLEQTNTTVIEYICDTDVYLCDPLTEKILYGKYGNRPFIKVLKNDKVGDPEDIQLIADVVETMANSKYASEQQLHMKMKARNGELHWIEMRFIPQIMGENETPKKIIITINDVNETIQSRKEINYMKEYDGLTGIYNHQTFVTRASELITHRSDTEYLIIRFDVERMKVINETFGHEEGNRLLKYIAAMIQNRVIGNGICGRLEADTFVVCIPNTENAGPEFVSFCDDCVSTFSLPFKIRLCYGIFEVTDRSIPVDLMLNHASFAHKSVKGNYQMHYAFYDDGQREKLLEEQEFLSEMKSGLEKREFKVYIQPKCDMSDNRIIGGEALVRWDHPEKGLIPPGKFIPVFEKHNLILSLDEYMWEETCKYLRSWLDAGLPAYPVSVNISRNNLYNPDLVKIIVGLVEKYNIPRDLLELEITESTYMSNAELLIDVTKQLQAEGFKVLMDDFGSGYSSLNMLKDIPVDVLKIDLRFLYNVNESVRAAIILSSVVKMARTLSLPVVAEGVETKDQVDFLLSTGCRTAQGFFYHKPMPAEEYAEKIGAQKKK